MATPHERTLIDVVRAHVIDRPAATVFAFEGRRLDFATLERLSNQAAHGLGALGLRAGQRIVYIGKNTDIFFAVWLAAMKIGAVMVPINWRLAPPEIAHIVRDTQAGIGLVGQELTDIVAGIEADLPGVQWLRERDAAWPDFVTNRSPRLIQSTIG